jgi:sugar phosphate isomerase/epimerase
MEPLALGVIVPGDDPVASLDKVRSLGLSTCQMLAPPAEWRSPERVEQLRDALGERGITITTMFCHFPGEVYTDVPTIRRVCGFVPAGTRDLRARMAREISDHARDLDLDVIAAHIGFIPENQDDPDYRAIVRLMQELCDHCGRNRQRFALETGQETAPALMQFIQHVGRDNLGVNFDPANMILYGSGEPIEALGVLGRYVYGAHAKDGTWPKQPGELGEEKPLGEGQVGIDRYVAKLKQIGYTGAITIEREISGPQQIEDIRRAIRLLESLR